MVKATPSRCSFRYDAHSVQVPADPVSTASPEGCSQHISLAHDWYPASDHIGGGGVRLPGGPGGLPHQDALIGARSEPRTLALRIALASLEPSRAPWTRTDCPIPVLRSNGTSPPSLPSPPPPPPPSPPLSPLSFPPSTPPLPQLSLVMVAQGWPLFLSLFFENALLSTQEVRRRVLLAQALQTRCCSSA